ncbi:MAG: protein translocase subunit SecD [Planctomycetota bacterium]
MQYPLWKPLLLIFVVVGCAVLLQFKSLNPGIDLAGGTTLTYAVQVPENQDAQEAIEQTIEILKERVDPAGIMNLVWRSEVGNRLSVQMALAPPEVSEKREAYNAALEKLETQNLPETTVRTALAQEAEARANGIATLTEEYPDAAEALNTLGQLADDRDSATATYRAALEPLRALQASLPPEPTEAQAAQLSELQNELDVATLAALDARDAFDDKLDELLADNLTAQEFAAALELPDAPRKGGLASAQDEAIANIRAAHPGKAGLIDDVLAAYDQYADVKGMLDDPNDLIRLLRGAGVLEFRIAAVPGQRPLDVASYRERLAEQGPKAGRTDPWRWFEISSLEEYLDEPRLEAILEQNPEAASDVFADRGVVGDYYNNKFYILLGNTPPLALTDQQDWELAGATVQPDQQGLPSVGFSMDAQGAALMGRLTENNIDQPMAIVLDGQIMSSPNIRGRISGQGQITGRYSQTEALALVQTLKAGSLGSTLSYDPIAIKTTGPQLGQDNLTAGVTASILSVCIVAAFMIMYYFVPGIIAVIALAGNIAIILGVMSLTSATFTLPGIAGLVLTIGMAVDANVLIFERIREEVRGGAQDLKTAVRLGFDKALSSILDANITTLLTCLVLYYTATSEIKGFAVVLAIGIVATLFTTLFGSRVLVDLLLVYGKAKKLPMLPSKVDAVEKLLEPSIDWFALRKFFIPFSLIIIVTGGFVIWERGVDLLDIEFRSGTEVTFEMAEGEGLTIQQARERLNGFVASAEPMDGVEWENLSGDEASVVTVGDTLPDGRFTGFSVATLIENADAVSLGVKEAFGDLLDASRPITFDRMDAELSDVGDIARPIKTGVLGQVIGDQFANADIGEYLGGVAFVLNDLDPPVRLDDVTERIERMRRQPDYVDLGYRRFDVLPLDDRPGIDDEGQPVYDRVVVVAAEDITSYVESPDTFFLPDGLADTEWSLLKDALSQDTSLASVSNFSSQVSGTMQQRAAIAMLLSLLVVIGYIALRFGSFRYGGAAIVALVHDVSAAVGLLAICNWLYDSGVGAAFLLDDFKINLAIIAAILTLIGYSLNDTIIVFDRIRENKGRLPEPTADIINLSINQTISRTVLTSGTTLMAVLVLYLFGGPGVHGFAFTMMIGVFVGTYSSFAVAAPLLILGKGSDPNAKQPKGKPAKNLTNSPTDKPAPAVTEKSTAPA